MSMAVRSLQFEDILSQLLGYTQKPLDTLRRLAVALDTAAAAHGRPQLGALGAILSDLQAESDAEDHKPVTQTSMCAGDVELF